MTAIFQFSPLRLAAPTLSQFTMMQVRTLNVMQKHSWQSLRRLTLKPVTLASFLCASFKEELHPQTHFRRSEHVCYNRSLMINSTLLL
jgi:arylamine N-acetyltransferase